MSVYKKLQKARIKLQSKQLKKSGQNKFAGYQYFELGDFLPTVQEIFQELGLCGTVSFAPEMATLRIVDVETDKEIVFTSPMGSAALKGCHEVQNIGAVETYQRRYLWVMAMEIVEHDALDATTGADPKVGKVIKSAAGAISAPKEIYESLSPEDRKKADRLAMLINEAFQRDEWGAFEIYDTEVDNEIRTGAWYQLESKTRTRLKQMKQEADKPVNA